MKLHKRLIDKKRKLRDKINCRIEQSKFKTSVQLHYLLCTAMVLRSISPLAVMPVTVIVYTAGISLV